MEITEKHRRIAKLLWEGNLTVEEIGKQEGVGERTIFGWKHKPEFQALLDELDQEAQKVARRILLKYAERASKVLVKLTEEKEGRFTHGEETVRKSAVDILESGGVKQPEQSQSGLGKSLIIIRNGNKT